MHAGGRRWTVLSERARSCVEEEPVNLRLMCDCSECLAKPQTSAICFPYFHLEYSVMFMCHVLIYLKTLLRLSEYNFVFSVAIVDGNLMCYS